MKLVPVFYEFRCDKCAAVEARPMPMKQAPALGSPAGTCKCGGTFLRIISTSARPATEKLKADRKYPYTEVKFGALEGASTNAMGQSIIESRRHEIEVCAKNGLTRV